MSNLDKSTLFERRPGKENGMQSKKIQGKQMDR